MKITKSKLKQIIREELENMNDDWPEEGGKPDWMSEKEWQDYQFPPEEGSSGSRIRGDEEEDLTARTARYDRNRFDHRDRYKG